MPEATSLRPLNKPTAAVCDHNGSSRLIPVITSYSVVECASNTANFVLNNENTRLHASATRSALSILATSLVSCVLGVKALLLPEDAASVSASKGLSPELGSKERRAEPKVDVALSSAACCCVDCRMSSPKLGSKAREVASVRD